MVMYLLMPVFVQVALTLCLFTWIASSRASAMKADPSLIKKAAADASLWPEKARQIANNYSSQFELPLLFYAAIAFILLTAQETILLVSFAWVFVFTRLIHSFIHTSSNNVMLRFYVFLVGFFALVAIWSLLAFGLYF